MGFIAAVGLLIVVNSQLTCIVFEVYVRWLCSLRLFWIGLGIVLKGLLGCKNGRGWVEAGL
jgi:hypothetical protein